MFSIERSITRFLNALRLHHVKSKIIAFSLLATLAPTLSMGWLSYRNNRRVLEEKLAQQLLNMTSHAARGLDLWLKERQHDVRVFSASYEVSENLDRMRRARRAGPSSEAPLERLEIYLASIEEKFSVYGELLVIDLEGNVVATSKRRPGSVYLPENWLEHLSASESSLGRPYRDAALDVGVIPIIEPIRDSRERLVGGLVAKLNFSGIEEILGRFGRDPAGNLQLVDSRGVILAASRPSSRAFMTVRMEPGVFRALLREQRVTRRFNDPDGTPVIGALEETAHLGWSVLAEQDREMAYAGIARLRNLTLLVLAGILLVIGFAAYALTIVIVKPLNRLTAGAGRIADGDLEVDLPIYSEGELGYMTRVFNGMASQLRQVMGELDAANQELRQRNEELRELSIRDPLTGLYNHKHMMETLQKESARSLRYGHPFAVLIIDIDEFKAYNDLRGHLIGDEVLKQVAATLVETLRAEDYVARYGGDEFLVLLPETSGAEGVRSAERIRERVQSNRLGADEELDGLTVSIGVASSPENGSDPRLLIARADAAMYRGKRGGRNRAVVAGRGTPEIESDGTHPAPARSKRRREAS